MRDGFISAIKANQDAFGLDLSADAIDRLAGYYDIVLKRNDLLHLVAPCSPAEFAIRHILESLTLLEHLPLGAKFADVGTGAGLPSIPCLIVREDLNALLIESKEKKVVFLNESVEQVGIASRTSIVNKQFSEIDLDDVEFITCRALDGLNKKLGQLIKWTGNRTAILFAGTETMEILKQQQVKFQSHLLPLSRQRYILVVGK